MSFNIKAILKDKADKRPTNLFEYILYYNGVVAGVDEVIMYPILTLTYLNEDVLSMLSNYDWFTFITTLTTDFPLPLGDSYNTYAESNIINDYIFNNYANYELLPKITDYFSCDNFTISDRNFMRTIVNGIVENVLTKNAEKYKKLYDAMTAEFEPLWNVDGTEVTTRTLERDGTETNAKTGTETDAKTGTVTEDKTGTVTDAKSGYDDLTKSGTETDAKTGTVTDAKTGTETLGKSGSDTTTKNGHETRDIDTTKASFNASTLQPTENVVDDLQYNNIQEQLTHSTTDTTTHDTTDTTTHNTSDTTTFNTTDRNTYNSSDTTTHNTSDTTTHNTTDTLTHNTSDVLTLDTVDTEHITVRRTGNIGVTSSTKLLTEYVDFAEYVDFVKTVSHDIVSELCYMTL